MSSNYPGALDTTADLPDNIGDNTLMDDPDHATLHNTLSDAVIALETKLGTGSSTASSGQVLYATGNGTSNWQQLSASNLSNGTTGSGSIVLATSPSLITPALGTPSSVTLTNGTGLPISSGVSGLGTGVATLLGGVSSGTGGPAGTTSPTFVTPTLGAATATSLNGLTITNSTGTLTIANGKTLTASNSLTLAGTDSTTMTFPSTSATIARTDTSQTFTGVQTFSSLPTIPQTPSTATDAASKGYVDATAQGLSVKPSAIVATTTGLPAYTYLSGVITMTSTGTVTIDGHTLALNDIVLVKNETSTNAPYNGLYNVTTAGAVGVACVLTRNSSMNTGAEFPGAFVFVESGSVNAAAGFVCTNTGTVTVGTTNITFVQFSGAGEITAGNGITITGNSVALTTPVTVANGGIGTGTAGIGAFNNITGLSAAGTTGTTSTNLVFSTSPTLVTPTLGVATATSVNGLTLTANSTGFQIAGGTTSKTAKFNNSLTFAGTDSTTMTFPSSSATIAGLGIAQTFTATQTVNANLITSGANANSFVVGTNGTTNPTLNVDDSTASAATGLNIKSAAAGSGLAVSTISSGTNENLTIDAKGSGTINLGSVSTGAVEVNSVPIVTTTAAQTLTNKTLTSPVISTITNTGTLTLPTSTDTLVGRATTDTLTNKTLTSNTNVLGGVTMTLGSDATGDTYYRNSSGYLTRLAVGSSSQALIGGTTPSWGAINLASMVTGNLPVTNLNSGTSASGSTFWRGDGTWATPTGAGNVSGPGSSTAGDIAAYSDTTGTTLKDPVVATIGGHPVWQYLGYAQITTTATQGGTTDTLVTGLSVTATVPTGVTKIRATVWTDQLAMASGSGLPIVKIWDGAVGSGTAITRGVGQNTINGYPATAISIYQPSTGSHTWNVSLASSSSGTASLEASSAYPAFILMECC